MCCSRCAGESGAMRARPTAGLRTVRPVAVRVFDVAGRPALHAAAPRVQAAGAGPQEAVTVDIIDIPLGGVWSQRGAWRQSRACIRPKAAMRVCVARARLHPHDPRMLGVLLVSAIVLRARCSPFLSSSIPLPGISLLLTHRLPARSGCEVSTPVSSTATTRLLCPAHAALETTALEQRVLPRTAGGRARY